jgi:hypothetical protein
MILLPIYRVSFRRNDMVENGKIRASQYINMEHAEKAARIGGGTVGQNVLHETLEAYIGAEMFPGQAYSQSNFNAAHHETIRIAPIPNIIPFWGTDDETNTTYRGIHGPTGKNIILYVRDQNGRIHPPTNPELFDDPR